MTAIKATLTRSQHGQPLIVLQERPFNGLEITPGELRVLAQRLLAIADMSAKLPMSGKHWRATLVTVGEGATK